MIAGLIRPDKGRIAVDGRVLVDTAARHLRAGAQAAHRLCVPGCAAVSASDACGRTCAMAAGSRRAASAMPRSSSVVDLLGIGHLLDRRPAPVGRREAARRDRPGAARQPAAAADGRAAGLARRGAQGRDPALYRAAARRDGMPIVYVSHSVAEVARLATDVVVLAAGKVAASGPTADDHAAARPAAGRGARRGRRGARHDGRCATTSAFGMTVLRLGGRRDPGAACSTLPAGAPVRVRIRARDVMIATEQPHGPQRAQHPARHDRRRSCRATGRRSRSASTATAQTGRWRASRGSRGRRSTSARAGGLRGRQDGELRPGQHRRRPARRSER